MLRPGTYEVSISELKKRTKCNACGVTGHWARECPTRPKRSTDSNPKNDESEFFYLELDSASSSNCPAVGDNTLASADREYMERPAAFPCSHMITMVDDFGCALQSTQVVNVWPLVSTL